MTESYLRIVRTEESGDLLVQAPHSLARRLRLMTAELLPDGLWRVPVACKPRIETLVRPEPVRQRFKPAPPRTVPSYQPPTPEEIKAWFNGLPTVRGVEISHPDSFSLGFRLKPHSAEALSLLKTIPGRVWNVNKGRWEVRIRTHHQLSAIAGVMSVLESAIASRAPRVKSPVEMVFSIVDAPDLNKPVNIDGQWVVFEQTSSMFRIHEGHGRQAARLVPHIGTHGSNFKGRFARADEIADNQVLG